MSDKHCIGEPDVETLSDRAAIAAIIGLAIALWLGLWFGVWGLIKLVVWILSTGVFAPASFLMPLS